MAKYYYKKPGLEKVGIHTQDRNRGELWFVCLVWILAVGLIQVHRETEHEGAWGHVFSPSFGL